MKFWSLSLVLFMLHISCSIRLVNAQQQCKYEFTVPSNTGNCKVSDPEIHTKLFEIINEIDSSRAQYASRNSVVNDKLAQIETQLARFNEMVAEVHQQMSHFGGQSTSGSGNQDLAVLQKAIMETKDFFIQSVHNIENKLFNLSTAVKTDSLKDVKIRATLDAEIQKQADQIKSAMDKIAQMDNSLKGVNSASGVFPTISAPQGNSYNTDLQSQLQNLAQSLQATAKKEEQRNQEVTSAISSIRTSVHSLTSEMENLRTKSQSLVQRFERTQAHTNTMMGTIMQKITETQDKLKQTITRISDLSLETKNLQSALHSITPSPVLGAQGSQATQLELQSLKAQMKALESQTSAIMSTMHQQTTKIDQMQKGVSALPPDLIAKLQTMAANPGTGSGSYAAELKDLKTKVDGLVKQLVPESKKITKHVPFAVPTLPPAGASRQPIVINPVGGNSYSYTFSPVRNIP